jgi:entericidin B
MKNAVLVLVAALALSACETVEGAGEDLQNAGQTIESEANNAQNDM